MKTKKQEISEFVEKLFKQSNSVKFQNPYRNEQAKINLQNYLFKMIDLKPKIMLVGEAPGHKGCFITGIPFTSEVILSENNFFTDGFFEFNKSKPSFEITSKIVWEYFDNKSKPLFWNIFPFHPHKSFDKESNRKPTRAEIKQGRYFFKELRGIFEIKTVIAIGRSAEKGLNEKKHIATYIPHPSFGRKKKFTKGLDNLLRKKNLN